jgi:hypothetical protein
MTAEHSGLEIGRPRAMVRVPREIGGVIESARMVGFDGLRDGKEHVAILFGEPTSVYGNQLNLGYPRAKVRHAGHVMDLDGSGS